MGLFTDEIDSRIKELQELDGYKYGKGKVNNKKIADTINAEFGTEYTANQIYHRRENLNPSGRERKKKYKQSDKGKEAQKKYEQSDKGKERKKNYAQSDKGKEARKNNDSKIAKKIYTNLVNLARTKYGREVLGLNYKETREYLKDRQLSIDHIEPIKMRYIENLCCWFGYRWKYWSDVPKHIQEKLKNMFNQIDNLQLIPMSENLAKRDYSNITRHY